jgi:hypothetical protein
VFGRVTPLTLKRIQPKTEGERRKQRDMCRRKKVEDLEESKNGRKVGRLEEMDKRIIPKRGKYRGGIREKQFKRHDKTRAGGIRMTRQCLLVRQWTKVAVGIFISVEQVV